MPFIKKHKSINLLVVSLVLFGIAAVFLAPAKTSAITVAERCRQQFSAPDDIANCETWYNTRVQNECSSGGRTAEATEQCVQNILGGSNQTTTGPVSTGNATGDHQCGTGEGAQRISLNLGCAGEKCVNNPGDPICEKNINPIVDALFAIIRFLSIGVGMVIVGSIVVAGIQFTSSQGDPQATAKALDRIRNTVIGLVIYFFIFAILNWLIPAGVFGI